ncbi:YggS family pyridoxal phosphate-dependent enzyme [Caldinitratiruptor microaerophilus]|uniref:YggS family pyridoxal phosphate-dependent enzyme n=1 Tax=Caldinitratiruptor microaerophilus TaxID=671077 RepID=UPI00223076F7|nr:YggS family pyridoxal phosphate-dependent enzyme [Caldinitratiruptor microaerophilus]
MSNITSNVLLIRERIARAAEAAGRSPEEICLVAVTKNRTPEEIREALAAGITDIGENRVQEALAKVEAVGRGCRWHMIGTLQTNKVRAALGFADLIHSLDRPELALAIDREARRAGRTVPVLIQVNVSGEATKHGVAPEGLRALVEQASALETLEVQGLMTIAPLAGPDVVRPVFARLRRLAEEVASWQLPRVEMRWLSMGMSGDFELAIAEGANLVRIGTAIFGPRPG